MRQADLDSGREYLARVEPTLEQWVPESMPVRYQQAGLYEGLCWAVIGQQLSVHAADAIHARVCALDAGAFPAPGTMANLSGDLLRSAGLSGAKARTLHAIAHASLDGRLEEAHLDALPDAEVERHLVAIPGVGPWTAAMVLLFVLGRPDVFATGDLALRRAMQRHFGTDPADYPALLARAEPWRPWRSVASLALWRSPA